MFYTVKIVDAIKREGAFEYRLIEYQTQAPTGAAARIKALEHHLARPDRGVGRVRWAAVEQAAIVFEPIVKISDAPIAPAELEQLERIHHPYVIA